MEFHICFEFHSTRINILFITSKEGAQKYRDTIYVIVVKQEQFALGRQSDFVVLYLQRAYIAQSQ